MAKKLRSKTYEEIFGVERAKEIKRKISLNCALRKNKGKTFEEVYGKEKAKSMKRKMIETLRRNPKIIEARVQKFKKTLKDNPSILEKSALRRKETYDKDPKIMKRAIKKHKLTLKKDPSIIKRQVEKCKKTLEKDPEINKRRTKKMSATKQGISLEEWNGFISKELYGEKWNNKFKSLIRERDNQICMLCKIHREKLNHALDVHHIDYCKINTIPKNCISLCRSCHTKTNKNRKYWAAFFQAILADSFGYKYNNLLLVEGLKNE